MMRIHVKWQNTIRVAAPVLHKFASSDTARHIRDDICRVSTAESVVLGASFERKKDIRTTY